MNRTIKVKCSDGTEFFAPPLIINFDNMDIVFEVCSDGFISPFTGEIMPTHEFPIPNVISEEKCQRLYNSTIVDDNGHEVEIFDDHIVEYVKWYRENNRPFPEEVYLHLI